MKTYIKHFIPAATLLLGMGMTSCVKDLDVEPLDPNVSTEYTPIGLYNKCYANFAMEGNAGGGSTDIHSGMAPVTGPKAYSNTIPKTRTNATARTMCFFFMCRFWLQKYNFLKKNRLSYPKWPYFCKRFRL